MSHYCDLNARVGAIDRSDQVLAQQLYEAYACLGVKFIAFQCAVTVIVDFVKQAADVAIILDFVDALALDPVGLVECTRTHAAIKLVGFEGAVAVVIEFGKCAFCGVADFALGDDAVVVGVDADHQRARVPSVCSRRDREGGDTCKDCCECCSF